MTAQQRRGTLFVIPGLTRNPGSLGRPWIPAFAGMTKERLWGSLLEFIPHLVQGENDLDSERRRCKESIRHLSRIYQANVRHFGKICIKTWRFWSNTPLPCFVRQEPGVRDAPSLSTRAEKACKIRIWASPGRRGVDKNVGIWNNMAYGNLLPTENARL